jgi:Na+/H+ antiporter NhaC
MVQVVVACVAASLLLGVADLSPAQDRPAPAEPVQDDEPTSPQRTEERQPRTQIPAAAVDDEVRPPTERPLPPSKMPVTAGAIMTQFEGKSEAPTEEDTDRPESGPSGASALPPGETPTADEPLAGGEADAGAPLHSLEGAVGVMDPAEYDWWVIMPPLVAILLAMLFRSAIPALAIGVIVGAYMMVPCVEPAAHFSDNHAIDGIRIAFEHYLIDSLAEVGEAQKGHLLIVLFTLTIGGMVGVIGVNGGSRALVERVARFASTSRRGQFAGWFAGMVVFFDDYANSMLIGPTMRPMFDRLRISRAKLAYIVDSTAAPIASIALIGTWLGAELGYIQEGLDAAADSAGGMPEFLRGVGNWDAFLFSIPYRFYAIFALLMVLLIALTRRDFGPMRRAECEALAKPPPGAQPDTPATSTEANATSAWLAAIPVLILVIVTVGLLFVSGHAGLALGETPDFRNILENADSYLSIFYGAVASLAVALVLTVMARACAFRKAVDGAIDGMARMLPAIVILVLAWSLSAVSQDLKLGDVLSGELVENETLAPAWLPSNVWLPLIVFVCAALVSFATGSSWTTMGILTPVVIPVAARMGEPLAAVDAIEMFYASVGGVLAGSIFGDHCSPISDTTVLSSVATSCRVEEHVWTQMPYALVVAIVAMGAGIIYTAWFHTPAWVALLFGAVILFLVLLLFGRRPVPPPAPLPAASAARVHRRVTGLGHL